MQQPISSTISVLSAGLLAIFVAGCASSAGPAPVEHRDISHPKPPMVVTGSRGLAVLSPPYTPPAQDQIQTPAPRPVIVAGQRETAPVPANPKPVATAPVYSGSVTQRELAPERKPDGVASPATTAAASDRPPSVTREPVATSQPPAVPAVSAKARAKEQIKPAASSRKAVREIKPKPAPEQKPVTKTATRPAFIWPANGALVKSATDSKGMGIGISGRRGDPISATASGKVIFSGLGPRGYGKLLIVKHAGDLLSVYAHNKSLLVKEGRR